MIGKRLNSGQIYEKNKQYYDDLAIDYINNNLVNIDDVCYVPFTMKTCYTRNLIKKVNDNTFIVFDGLVAEIKEISSDKIEYLSNNFINLKEYSKSELVEVCGFEYSLNPFFRKDNLN